MGISLNGNLFETNIINIAILVLGLVGLVVRFLDEVISVRRKEILFTLQAGCSNLRYCSSFLEEKRKLLDNLTSFEEDVFSERLRRFYFLVAKFWVYQNIFQLNELVLSFIVSLNAYRRLIFFEVLEYLSVFIDRVYQSIILDLDMSKVTVVTWLQIIFTLFHKQNDKAQI